jgi:Flp pilus assembly protein TadB
LQQVILINMQRFNTIFLAVLAVFGIQSTVVLRLPEIVAIICSITITFCTVYRLIRDTKIQKEFKKFTDKIE